MLKIKNYFIAIFVFLPLVVLSAAPKGGRPAMPPALVDTIIVKEQVWQDEIKTTGSLSAIKGVTIVPEVAGVITKIYFQSGQMVKEGELLIQINPAQAEADLAKAQAQKQLSELQYNRLAQLHKKNFASMTEVDKAKSTLEIDRASVKQAKAKLKQLNIVAPFSGKLGLCKVSVGDYVNSGIEIVNLQQLDKLKINFSVAGTYSNDVKVGDEVNVMVNNSNQSYQGKIAAIDSKIDPDTRSLDLEALIKNKDNKLLPGAFIEVVLHLGKAQPTKIIPQTAIEYSAEGAYVYRIVDKVAKKIKVTLGKKLADNRVVIINGLNVGDVIVTAGQVKLYDGAAVMING